MERLDGLTYQVLKVTEEDGQIWHYMDAEMEEGEVSLSVD